MKKMMMAAADMKRLAEHSKQNDRTALFVDVAIEWIESASAEIERLNRVAEGMPPPDWLNRRAAVEQELLDVANGKKDLPDRAQCRAWAMRLGVPTDWGSFGKTVKPDPETVYEDRQ